MLILGNVYANKKVLCKVYYFEYKRLYNIQTVKFAQKYCTIKNNIVQYN